MPRPAAPKVIGTITTYTGTDHPYLRGHQRSGQEIQGTFK